MWGLRVVGLRVWLCVVVMFVRSVMSIVWPGVGPFWYVFYVVEV